MTFHNDDQRKPHDWITNMNLEWSRDWLYKLKDAQILYGSHPQLECDIKDIEDQIKRLEGS